MYWNFTRFDIEFNCWSTIFIISYYLFSRANKLLNYESLTKDWFMNHCYVRKIAMN